MILPFEVSGSGLDAVGTSGGFRVSFLGNGKARMFLRRAIKLNIGNPGIKMPDTLLVAELNGVRSYIRRLPTGEVDIVMSSDDVYP